MEDKKIVNYNGNTMKFYGCLASSKLEIGKNYTVIKEIKIDSEQSNYFLEEVEGIFNSHWFDDVKNIKRLKRRVIYNGNTMRYLRCSDASLLEVGEEYTVIRKVKRCIHQTDYFLEEVEGRFPSSWFDKCKS